MIVLMGKVYRHLAQSDRKTKAYPAVLALTVRVGGAEGAGDQLVGVEVDLPVMAGGRVGDDVGDGGKRRLQAGDGIERIDAEGQLRRALDAAITERRKILDRVVRNLAIADDRLDVVRAGDDRVEQADFGDRALDAAGDDIVADLVGAEDDQEGARREIAEQPRPGRSDGEIALQRRIEIARRQHLRHDVDGSG